MLYCKKLKFLFLFENKKYNFFVIKIITKILSNVARGRNPAMIIIT